MDLNPVFGSIGRDDQSWLGSARGATSAQSIGLLMSAFVAATHYPNGYFPSGIPLSKITSGGNSGLYGPADSVTVADGVTNSTTTVTSASANFEAGDVGATISGSGIPAGTTIASVTNPTTVVMSAAATATASGVSITVQQTLSGFLLDATTAPRNTATTVINGALLDTGRIVVANLPIAVNAATQATNPRFVFV